MTPGTGVTYKFKFHRRNVHGYINRGIRRNAASKNHNNRKFNSQRLRACTHTRFNIFLTLVFNRTKQPETRSRVADRSR